LAALITTVYYTQPAHKENFITTCLSVLRGWSSWELHGSGLQLLYAAISGPDVELSPALQLEIEATFVFSFISDLPDCRALALNYMRYLAARRECSVYLKLRQNELDAPNHPCVERAGRSNDDAHSGGIA
jgi:hypothetical protein